MKYGTIVVMTCCGFFATVGSCAPSVGQQPAADTANLADYGITKLKVGPGDWPQWGGTSLRNNAPHGKNIPTDWSIADADFGTVAKNIKWSAKLGYLAIGSPVVADGKVYVGTNNPRRGEEPGYVARFRRDTDLGCLLCFDERTGRFLWQHSVPKLRVKAEHDHLSVGHDWPSEGIHSAPLVDGDRLWYLTNRCEVVCLDTAGFADGENDGPFRDEDSTAESEADVVWKLDLFQQFGVRPHEHTDCCVTCAGDILFVITGNGVDQGHVNIPAPQAPSFMALDRRTAKVLWTSNSPGSNILHGTWGSPTFAVLGGRPQLLMVGGDGWLYSFDPRGDGQGKSKLWWKFDGNPKSAKLRLGDKGTKNEFLGAPVVYDRKVYFAMGQDPEHGEGPGLLWCIDPTRYADGRDVSEELIVDGKGEPVPPTRIGGGAEPGQRIVPNPSSAVVWRYTSFDLDGNGKIAFEETMHRTAGTVAVRDDLLYVVDRSGLLHCVDAQQGRPHWTHDFLSGVTGWNTAPLLVEGKVYVAHETEITIVEHSKVLRVLNTVEMPSCVETTPIVANDVLFIAMRGLLCAIAHPAASEKSAAGKPE